MTKILVVLLAAIISAGSTLYAQPADTSAPFQPNLVPTLDIRRAPGAIQIDGELDDAGWSGAARATNFAESYPGNMTRPLVNTEAFLTYDDQNLYVAIICYDDPAEIRATLHNRDEMWNEDMAGIIVDTYGGANWAYEIFTNARGVQGDLLWSTDNEDTRFDLIFSSDARITEKGYQVEMAIPFNSLRFPDQPKQAWRLTFWRIHPRDSRREYTWSAINQDNPCQFCQYGIVTGIENVKPGGALEFLPSVIGYQSATAVRPPGEPLRLENGPLKADAGLGIRYAFSTSMTGEVTINPDYSQVESDAAQIDVNSAFALSYPEKRPFFQEGSDLFSTWLSAVYTRTINDPLVAAKFTGRLGSANIAYLGAYDENSPIIIPGEEQSRLIAGGRTVSNIVRARQSLSQESFIGGIVTDMRLDGGGSSTTFGTDALLRFWDIYQLEWQTLLSYMAEPNWDNQRGTPAEIDPYSPEFDGQNFWGQATYLSLERNSRHWRFDLDYYDSDRGFRAANGFKVSGNLRQFNANTAYAFRPELEWMDRFTPSLTVGGKWNHAGVHKDQWIIPQLEIHLKGQSWLEFSYMFSRELYRGKQFDSIRWFEFHGNTYFSNTLGGGMDLRIGRFIARNLQDPVLGRGADIGVYATVKPLQQFNIQPQLNYFTLQHPDTREYIYDGYVLRTNFNYQFSHELFLRLVLQYDDFSKAFALEPLMTYRINPFTMFYVGSTHDFTELDETGNERRYTATGRQFFAKFQYLMQI